MLVLERRSGQTIILNTSDGIVEVVVTQSQAGRVKLGITAPMSVSIVRKELIPLTNTPQNKKVLHEAYKHPK